MHVLSTADVPDQRRRTNIPTLRVLLPIICERLTGKHLPPELVEYIVSADLGGITREMAEKHRLEFMEDRRVKVTKEDEVRVVCFPLPLQGYNGFVDFRGGLHPLRALACGDGRGGRERGLIAKGPCIYKHSEP